MTLILYLATFFRPNSLFASYSFQHHVHSVTERIMMNRRQF